MYYLPWWMQWAQAVALIVISCLGSWIAYKQVRIASAKLNLDLYDRRFKVYEAARTFLSHFMVNAAFTGKEISDYNFGVSDAVFLFDKDVKEYLDGFRKKAFDLGLKNTQLRNLPPDSPAREALVDALYRLEIDLSEEFPRLIAVFKPYLKLGNI
jgi:hypothetical protein